MPSYRIPGCTGTFSELPEAQEFIRQHYKDMSMRDLALTTGVAYHNIARFMEVNKLLADRYTTKRRNISLALALTPLELAYLAGIIDGEGTISVAQNSIVYLRPHIVISNTSTLLAEWLRIRGFAPHWAKNTIGRDYWRISWSGFSLDKLLPLIRPYLVIKARHADLLLELISLRRQQSKNSPLTERMHELVLMIAWLNDRTLSSGEKEKRDALSISSLNTMFSQLVDY